jgi:dephospho-CoA kinase
MNKIIGLTGGMGSGKTTIANYFIHLGIPVYIADDEAKRIMQSAALTSEIRAIFGNSIFEGTTLNRNKLAQIVFNNSTQLEQLNAIVHPAVRADFQVWRDQNNTSKYVVYETAILFESGFYKNCDCIITVTAPLESRLQRVILRDSTTREQVLQRIAFQWTDDQRIEKSTFVIDNSNSDTSRIKFNKILKILNII